MLHLGRLEALREVADRGTITAAAEALHLTPSAVSQQISALERELGERLVEREGRGVRLTPTGRVLIRGADAVFAAVASLRAEVARFADGDGADLRVAAFATAITRIVAPAARELASLAPGVRLEVVEAEGEQAFAQLARSELDAVVSIEAPGAPPHDDPRVARRPLTSDPLVAALPAEHPAAAMDAVPLGALASGPWVAPPEGWLCERVILAACQSAGFTPRVVHRAGDWHAIVALCGAGLGVGLVPALASPRPVGGAVLRPLEAPVPHRHIFMACRRGAEHAPALSALLDALGRAAQPAATRATTGSCVAQMTP